jgi:hypothetical protein
MERHRKEKFDTISAAGVTSHTNAHKKCAWLCARDCVRVIVCAWLCARDCVRVIVCAWLCARDCVFVIVCAWLCAGECILKHLFFFFLFFFLFFLCESLFDFKIRICFHYTKRSPPVRQASHVPRKWLEAFQENPLGKARNTSSKASWKRTVIWFLRRRVLCVSIVWRMLGKRDGGIFLDLLPQEVPRYGKSAPHN